MQPERRNVDQLHNNDMNIEKDRLERAFRLSTKQAEDASTSSSQRCAKVLEALQTFLTQWDALEEDEIDMEQGGNEGGTNISRDLPCDYLNVVFCRMLANLDPVKNGDTVREKTLSILRSLQTAPCRQVVLNFLPAVTRIFVGSKNSSNAWAEGKSKRAKKQILSCLREVFENDPNSLSQLLRFFSYILKDALPRKHVLVSRDIFLFVVEGLPKVPETNLHVALRALIQYVDSSDDARLAVDSVRTELALLEKTDISDMAPVAAAFDEAARGTNKREELFVEEYFVVLEELVNEQRMKRYRSQNDDDRHVDDVENQLLTFDLVMMILLKESIAYRDRILRLLSDGSLIQSGLLSGARVTRLVELASDGSTSSSETAEAVIRSKLNPCTHLLESLVAFSVSILLTPLHSTVEFDTKAFFSKIQGLLIDVVTKLPKEFQTKAIHLALEVADELMKTPEKSTAEDASRERLERKGNTRTRICLNVFLLLLSLVSRERDILAPFQKHLVNYVTSESFDYIGKVDLLQTLCTIVAKAYFRSGSNGPLHSVAICRMLLFSSPSVDAATKATQIEEKMMCRRIRGMVFASAIISNCDLDSTLLVTMQKMASRVLLSPYSTIVMLDPRIGLHGMKLLRCIRAQSNCDHSSGRDLFGVASLVLSHSRIVHYPDISPEQSTTKSTSIFAYNNVPSVFPFDNKTEKQLRFRKMLFRFNYFFTNETLLDEPSNWERSSLWIFEMINTYLYLGRTVKWNPRAWIFAGIEFPGVHSSALITERRKEKLLLCLRHYFSSFESSKNSRIPISRMDKQISEVIKGAKTISEKEVIVNSMCRFALSMLFALSTSIAVLCNTYSHFEDILEEGCDRKESNQTNEALQMIHYQFAKIYDIQRGCQSMERLFRNLGSRSQTGGQKRSRKTKKRRLNTPSAGTQKTKFQIKAETVALHLRESLTIVLHYTKSIPKKLFWICLTDQSHDKIIISAVKNLQQNETIEPIFEVIQFRLNLIQHLGTTAPHALLADTEATLEKMQSRFQGSIVRCLRLTSFLLLNFSSLKRTTESDQLLEGLIKLISAYVRLACSILISEVDYEQTCETNNRDASYIFGIYLSTFGSKQPLDRTDESVAVSDSVNLEDFDKLVSSFQGHIGGHHTCITSQLLETLSIFAARSGSIILDRMIDINWSATFLSKYKNGDSYMDNSGAPFALVEVLKSISRRKPQGFVNAPFEECCSHRVVTKLMKHRYNKSLERHQYLVQSMRRHWALIALSSRRLILIVDFLNTLLGKLTEYLKDVDDCVEQNVHSKDNELLPGHDDDDDDDDEYLPPSTNAPLIIKPSIPTPSDFSCLTADSYPIYLDMLMRMTVSSIALFSIPDEISRLRQPATTSYRHHPVHKLERMTIVYGELFKLYKDKFHIFPKFLHSSIINVSKCMLDVSITKSQEYIEWRNCQPVLHFQEEKIKGFDVASTRFLKKLLNTFGLNVIGPLRAFCSTHSRSTTIQGGRHSQIQKGNQFPTIPGLRLLERKCERTFVFFSQTSDRYGTGEVKTEDIVRDSSQCEHDASTKVPEEFSKTEQSSTIEDVSSWRTGQESHKETVNMLDSSSIRKRSSRRGTPIQSVGNYDPPYSEDEESFIDDNDDSSSSTSDAFGVSGDWGQQSEDSTKEDNSEFFIDRFQKSS